jgi:hypothetical protein
MHDNNSSDGSESGVCDRSGGPVWSIDTQLVDLSWTIATQRKVAGVRPVRVKAWRPVHPRGQHKQNARIEEPSGARARQRGRM